MRSDSSEMMVIGAEDLTHDPRDLFNSQSEAPVAHENGHHQEHLEDAEQLKVEDAIVASQNLTWIKALKEIISLAAPLALSLSMQSASTFTLSYFISHLGSTEAQRTMYRAGNGLISSSMQILIGTAAYSMFPLNILIKRISKDDTKRHEKIRALISAMFINGFIIASAYIFLAISWSPLLLLIGQPLYPVQITQRFFLGTSFHTMFFAWVKIPQQFFLSLKVGKEKNPVQTENRPISMKICSGLRNISQAHYSYFFNATTTVALSYWLLNGGLGIAPLGALGAGLGCSVSSILTLTLTMTYIKFKSELKAYVYPLLESFDRIKEIFWPTLCMSLSYMGVMLIESMLNAASTFLCGALGETALNAVQLITPYFVFLMIPIIGIQTMAGAIVSDRLTKEKLFDCNILTKASLLLGALYTSLAAAALFFLTEKLMSVFIDTANPNNADVIALGKPLFIISGINLLLDSFRMIGSGLLRAYDDQKTPVFAALTSFLISVLSGRSLRDATASSEMAKNFTGLNGVFFGRALGLLASNLIVGWQLRKKLALNRSNTETNTQSAQSRIGKEKTLSRCCRFISWNTPKDNKLITNPIDSESYGKSMA